MKVRAEIKKTKQQLARVEASLAREQLKKRKADTRRKIEFGGLVIKANIDKYPKDVILGALLHAVEQINTEDGAYLLFQSKGKEAFMGYNIPTQKLIQIPNE